MKLKTSGKKKLRKALVRVEKVVVMDIRKQLEQQRKWKAEVVKRRNPSQASVQKKQQEAAAVAAAA